MLNNFDALIEELVANMREIGTPRRPNVVLKHPNRKVTGNLKYNGIRIEKINNGYKIYIDENIAPYMPFTNEEWTSPKWKGAKNPNEKWFDKVAFNIAKTIAEKYKADLIIK